MTFPRLFSEPTFPGFQRHTFLLSLPISFTCRGVGTPTIARYFDTTAFASQTRGTLGSERKNPLYGPPYRHVDFALSKTLPIHENIDLRFQAESFNLGEPDNFCRTKHTVGQSDFGTITSTSPNYNPREFQFVLKLEF